MGYKNHRAFGIGLACLLSFWAASWNPAQAGKTPAVSGATGQTGQTTQTAPTITLGLQVNGANTACGASVASGSQVCLLLTSDQTGTAQVTLQTGAGAASTVSSGSVTAGQTYSVCATAGTADGLTRTYTVTVINSSGVSSTQQCSYTVPVGVQGATGQTGQTGQTTPTLTTSLVVNGVAQACGASVASGAQVCLMFTASVSGTAVVTLQKGTATATEANEAVVAGQTYSVCLTAGAADGLTRTFTVTVTSASGVSASQQCSYVVPVGVQGATGQTGKTTQTAPNVTASLQVNGTAEACGVSVASGAQVCLLLTSDQTGTAVVTIQKGTGAPVTQASGAVTAGQTYSVCVTAGTADGLTRTFTVTVTNSSGVSASQQCSYVVPVGVQGATGKVGAPTVTASLQVNGVAQACGASVASGAQVCLLFTSDQSGTAVVTLQNGTAMATVANEAVVAGQSYSVCVTAGAADGLTRTFTITVTNSSGVSGSQQCSYVVPVAVKGATGQTGKTTQTGPTITTSLQVNGTAAACGASAASGSQVCLLLSSDQTGTAVVTLQTGTGTATTVASGSVTAGQMYSFCQTAGTADGLTRTLTVTVTSSSGVTSTQQCSYVVP